MNNMSVDKSQYYEKQQYISFANLFVLKTNIIKIFNAMH